MTSDPDLALLLFYAKENGFLDENNFKTIWARALFFIIKSSKTLTLRSSFSFLFLMRATKRVDCSTLLAPKWSPYAFDFPLYLMCERRLFLKMNHLLIVCPCIIPTTRGISRWFFNTKILYVNEIMSPHLFKKLHDFHSFQKA